MVASAPAVPMVAVVASLLAAVGTAAPMVAVVASLLAAVAPMVAVASLLGTAAPMVAVVASETAVPIEAVEAVVAWPVEAVGAVLAAVETSMWHLCPPVSEGETDTCWGPHKRIAQNRENCCLCKYSFS